MEPQQAEPEIAQIEQATRRQPIVASTADENPRFDRRVNIAILALTAALYTAGALGLVFQAGGFAVFGSVGLANLLVCVHAQRTRRILGIAFRSRLIARREREPILYWMSFLLFAISGVFILFLLFAVGR
jgi:hypothetical protein